MRKPSHLVEFIGEQGHRFYNKDIKCPVCGETMCYDDTDFYNHDEEVRFVCNKMHCKMQIRINDYIAWDDILEEK